MQADDAHGRDANGQHGITGRKDAQHLIRRELDVYKRQQSTQMIVGASPETDYHILKLTEGMYQKYSLKRVFYSCLLYTSPSPTCRLLAHSAP